MQTATQEGSVSKRKLWAGRIISGLVAAFMVFDGVMKVMKAAPVVEAAARLEYLLNVTVGIGALLLICTAIYVIPRTSVLGAPCRPNIWEAPLTPTCAPAIRCLKRSFLLFSGCWFGPEFFCAKLGCGNCASIQQTAPEGEFGAAVEREGKACL